MKTKQQQQQLMDDLTQQHIKNLQARKYDILYCNWEASELEWFKLQEELEQIHVELQHYLSGAEGI